MNNLTLEKYSNDHHVMIDIETFSKGQNKLIYQLSAIWFNPLTGETFEEFDEFINIQSSLDAGLKIDGSTLMYWLTNDNSELSKSQFNELKNRGVDIYDVLTEFSKFLNIRCNSSNVYVYGNGPTFDLQALIDAYNACNIKIPWMYYNERCQRTLEAFSPFIRKTIKAANPDLAKTAHNGLVDCKLQILAIHEIIKSLSKFL